MEQFVRGRDLFDKNFHRTEGLGFPDFNADSCRACHSDPVMGGAGPLEVNVFRAGRDNGGAGPFENIAGGQVFSKLRSPWFDDREEYDPEVADVFEQRNTPTLFGTGLIDQIPDEEILSREDPDDLDGDGIRGVARRIMVNGQEEIGKFGWKAQIPMLADFMRDAMGGENGITTPDDNRGFAFVSDTDGVPDPELDDAGLDDLLFFIANLGAPQRTKSTDPNVELGEEMFHTVGCAQCHVPELQGLTQAVPLFSDLLLHNVMPDGFRGMAEPDAPAGFYRTPPLWGIKDTKPYMHDGRASNLDAAILAHHGEADVVRQRFEALPGGYQRALVRFLEDL
jgi:CxxC motif-containing protein (DUF1111 family)